MGQKKRRSKKTQPRARGKNERTAGKVLREKEATGKGSPKGRTSREIAGKKRKGG